jgi:hypothetical protein
MIFRDGLVCRQPTSGGSGAAFNWGLIRCTYVLKQDVEDGNRSATRAQGAQLGNLLCLALKSLLRFPQSSRFRVVLTSRTCGRDRYLSKLHYLQPDKRVCTNFCFVTWLSVTDLEWIRAFMISPLAFDGLLLQRFPPMGVSYDVKNIKEPGKALTLLTPPSR